MRCVNMARLRGLANSLNSHFFAFLERRAMIVCWYWGGAYTGVNDVIVV